jgi:hypothetical protein
MTGRTRYGRTYEMRILQMDIPLVMVVSCFHDLHIGSTLCRRCSDSDMNNHVQRLPSPISECRHGRTESWLLYIITRPYPVDRFI